MKSPEVEEAVGKYEEFHRYAPTAIGEFHKDFSIPAKMIRAGHAKWVTYRSGKVDPSTLKKPRKPVDYIHEHDAGVTVYLPRSAATRDLGLTELVDVPAEFREVEALTCLGESLGFCFKIDGDDDDLEAESVEPMPELYCSPDGHCLYVIQSKRELVAAIWGGGLGVFARGIDG